MAKCLRCGAGNEWIEGDARKAPVDDDTVDWKLRAERAIADENRGLYWIGIRKR